MNQNKFNPYMQVYIDLEREVKDLAIYVDFSDDQLGVHSSKIVTLILRVASEVESIVKSLYRQETGESIEGRMSFEGPLKGLVERYGIEDVTVLLHGREFYLSDPFFKPFRGWVRGWKKAYNMLKHDRLDHQYSYGNIYNLLNIMATLYILNCLFVSPKENRQRLDTRVLVGSTIFSRVFVHDGKLGRMVSLSAGTFVPLDGTIPDSIQYDAPKS